MSPIGLPLALAAIGITAVLVLAGPLNPLGSSWVTYGFIAVVVAVLAFLLGGLIFGY